MSKMKRTKPSPDQPLSVIGEDRLLTLEQVGEILIVPPTTVRLWILKGLIKGIRIGRFWRVRESEVKAFLERSEFKTEEES